MACYILSIAVDFDDDSTEGKSFAHGKPTHAEVEQVLAEVAEHAAGLFERQGYDIDEMPATHYTQDGEVIGTPIPGSEPADQCGTCGSVNLVKMGG